MKKRLPCSLCKTNIRTKGYAQISFLPQNQSSVYGVNFYTLIYADSATRLDSTFQRICLACVEKAAFWKDVFWYLWDTESAVVPPYLNSLQEKIRTEKRITPDLANYLDTQTRTQKQQWVQNLLEIIPCCCACACPLTLNYREEYYVMLAAEALELPRVLDFQCEKCKTALGRLGV